MEKSLRLTAIAAAVLACIGLVEAETIPASAYVQRGLVAHFDAIDNEGTGVHNVSAKVWKNLVADGEALDMTLTSYGVWEGGRLLKSSNSAKISAKGTGPSAIPATMEMCYTLDAHPGSNIVLYDTGCANANDMLSFIALLTTSRGFLFNRGPMFACGSNYSGTHSVSFCYTAPSATYDGAVLTKGADNYYGRSAPRLPGYATVGGFADGQVNSAVKAHAIRLYSEVLTDAERAWNAQLDEARFELPETCVRLSVEGVVSNVEYLVSFTSDPGLGTINATVDAAAAVSPCWTRRGQAITLTPNPASGYRFYEWTGDVEGLTPDANGVISFDGGRPRSLTCRFINASYSITERTWTGAGGDGQWTTAANWSDSVVPAAGDAVTIGDGASVTCSVQTARMAIFTLTGSGTTLVFKEPALVAPSNSVAELRADYVYLVNGATVTHVRQEQQWADASVNGWKVNGRVKISCIGLTVDATSKINCNGKGYYCHNEDKVNGPSGYGDKGSPGHGGYGNGVSPGEGIDNIWKKIRGPTSDDPAHPVEPGSSGSCGDKAENIGVEGGGTIRIAATGDVVIDGSVTADAGTRGGSSRKGGAGGSVWISCRTIAGSGKVSAAGAMNSTNTSADLCGGGGMVAVHYDPAAQAAVAVPNLALDAGLRTHSNLRGNADVGTLYLTDTRLLRDEYNGASGVIAGNLIVGDWGSWAPGRLSVSGGAWIRFPSGAIRNWNLSAISVSGSYSRLDFGGEEFFMVQRGTVPLVSTNAFAVNVSGGVSVSGRGYLGIYAAPTNVWTGLPSATLTVAGAFDVGANGTVSFFSHPMNGAIAKVNCGSLSVASTGAISATGTGFGGGTNGVNTASFGPANLKTGGAAHGGYAASGKPVGDLENPLLCGSGGGKGDSNRNGSAGGGVVYFNVAGNCDNNGTISADGPNGWIGSSAGAGAGGSVNVTAGTFTGSGTFSAHGGVGQQATNAGGGGRVALHYDATAQAALASQPTFTFNTYTYGAKTYNITDSDYGTVYLTDATFARGLFYAGKFQYVNLALGDWTDFDGDAIDLSGSRMRLMNCPSMSFPSITLNNFHLGFGRGLDCWSDQGGKRYYPANARGVDITIAGNVVITNSAELHCYGGITNGNTGVINMNLAMTNRKDRASENVVQSGIFTVGGKMTVYTNSWVRPASHPVHGGSVTFKLKELEVKLGGGFDASKLGWGGSQKGEGPGAGGGQNSAGSYGGAGSGPVYGWAKMPVLPGSGGGVDRSGGNGGPGGGVVRLEVRRSMTLAGTLNAGGNTDGGGTWNSGGAGGSVYVKASKLTCEAGATIKANGGNGNKSDGKRGGGGRVAVLTSNGTIDGFANLTVSATQGTSGKNTSKDGTIYFGALSAGTTLILK